MPKPMPDQELLGWPPWRPGNDLAPLQRRLASWRPVCKQVCRLARLVVVCVGLSVVLLSG